MNEAGSLHLISSRTFTDARALTRLRVTRLPTGNRSAGRVSGRSSVAHRSGVTRPGLAMAAP